MLSGHIADRGVRLSSFLALGAWQLQLAGPADGTGGKGEAREREVVGEILHLNSRALPLPC
jgi:hypothetical protein